MLAKRGSSRMHAALKAPLVAVSLVLASIGLARAHPHVFVVVKSDLVFAPDGHIIAIRHAWTFDDMYSAFVTAGLSADHKIATKEQLAPLAKTNVEELAEFNWFTVAKDADAKLAFEPPSEYSLEEGADKLVTLRFTLPLKTPAEAKK